MNIKYKVTLTSEERNELKALIKTGRTQGYRIRHAQILLAVDDIPENADWTDKKIAAAYDTSEKTIGSLRRRFVEKGFKAALERQKRENLLKIKINGEIEAKIVALTCFDAPEGHSRWTLRLLANKVVELGIMDQVSHTAIANTLKKTKLSHGYKSNGASQSHLRNS